MGANLSVLSLNCGNYKQNVHVMVAGQRDVLGMREAELRRAEHELVVAARRHEALAQLMENRADLARREDERREQKKIDELANQWASQGWNRGRDDAI
jgi:flagellar export protein FliJ